MVIILDDEGFETQMLNKIADFFNEKSQEHLTIYLHSDGGRIAILDAILDLINSNPERFTLIGFNKLASCAFELYIKANCNKRLLNGTFGMYHLGYGSVNYNEKMQAVTRFDDALIKRKTELYYPQTKQFMSQCEFTAEEEQVVAEGKDLWIQTDRFIEMERVFKKNQINEAKII